MPYIVTTTTGPHMIARGRHRGHETRGVTSDVATLTLEEARRRARLAVVDAWSTKAPRTFERLLAEADALPEQGGTIGPLPDGTVIEVAPALIHDLATAQGMAVHAGDWRGSTTDAQIIDGYNAGRRFV